MRNVLLLRSSVLGVLLAAGNASAEDKDVLADPDACQVRGDDGVWRTCADILEGKKTPPTEPSRPEPPVDEDPESRALRARMRALEEEQAKAPVKERELTDVEKGIEKARLDPKLPLLKLRIAAARAEQAVKALEAVPHVSDEKVRAERELAQAKLILDEVERIALHRMDVCQMRGGKKSLVKNYRMTPAGPIMLTSEEMLARLPLVDPAGCERIFLVDKDVVDRVLRIHELREILATRTFGYFEVAERKLLEKELDSLEKAIAREAVPALSAPGVRDPYGSYSRR